MVEKRWMEKELFQLFGRQHLNRDTMHNNNDNIDEDNDDDDVIMTNNCE